MLKDKTRTYRDKKSLFFVFRVIMICPIVDKKRAENVGQESIGAKSKLEEA